MTRAKWKGPYIDKKILIKFKRFQANKRAPRIKVWTTSSTILPKYINSRFDVYNGKIFISLLISEDMVGHKFGEFVYTRARFFHKKQKKLRKK
jgi:small subunit ribosomal protein S19